MMTKLRKLAGVATLEFALVIPVLVILMAGAIELSILFYDKAIITNASREGARYGVALRTPTYPTTEEIKTYVKNYCADYLITFSKTPTEVLVTAVPSAASPKFGDTLTVTVQYTYTDLMLHNFINHGEKYELTATTVMTYE